MREHGLQPRGRRRFIATTDSNHDGLIFPNLSRHVGSDRSEPALVSDITYVALPTALHLGCRHPRCLVALIVGYAIARSIDGRLTLAALNAAIERRQPPPGCIQHSDRGSQYAAHIYRAAPEASDLIGSMGRRGNPHDTAKAESFMKTLRSRRSIQWPLKLRNVTELLPHFIEEVTSAGSIRRSHI